MQFAASKGVRNVHSGEQSGFSYRWSPGSQVLCYSLLSIFRPESPDIDQASAMALPPAAVARRRASCEVRRTIEFRWP